MISFYMFFKLLLTLFMSLQIGPGIVYLRFDSFFGKGVFIQSLCPVEPMVQKLVHNIYIHWTVPNFIAKFFMLGESIQVCMLENIVSPKSLSRQELSHPSDKWSYVMSHDTVNLKLARTTLTFELLTFFFIYVRFYYGIDLVVLTLVFEMLYFVYLVIF